MTDEGAKPAGQVRAPRPTPLAAKSPFELRVNLGRDVPESDVRTALATGDMGFLHSFTTGSAVDGPGVRVVAWTAGCMWRCVYCHNPDTWTMTNGIPVTLAQAVEELRKYRHGLKTMSGGFTLSGGEALMQHRFAVKLLSAARAMGIHTALDTNGYYGDRLSDAELEVADLVILEDDKHDQPVYAPVPIIREAVLRAHPEIASIVRPLMQSFSRDGLQALNARVQIDGESAESVAEDYLRSRGFVR